MANNRGYKRSWKNYLLDSSYQLRFTFTILAVAAGLMAPLGWWVSVKATSATEVALTRIDGIACNEVLTASSIPNRAPKALETEEAIDLLDESAVELDAGSALDAAGSDGGLQVIGDETSAGTDPDPTELAGEADEDKEPEERTRRKIAVDIDVVVGSVVEPPVTPAEIEASKADREACLANINAKRKAVTDRQSLIQLVMVLSALLLLLCLGFYGILSTHKVAGPLFKVGLYLGKVENDIYDTVYNLRKGDQLVDFYDHFKAAHAGLTTMQEEDRDRLRDAIALAKDAGLTEDNPKMTAIVSELERLLAQKEESLVRTET